MIPPVTLTKEVEKERVLLQSISSLGIVISLHFFNSGKTMVKKSSALEIYFMDFGFLIYLWKELEMIKIGHLCVLMNALGLMKLGVKVSMIYILCTKKQVGVGKLSGHGFSGKKLLMPKFLLELPIWFTKMRATEKVISKI